MSRYFIDLSGNKSDRMYLKPSQVDTANYDNNRGYMVYVLSDFDGKFCFRFPTADAREDFVNENGIDDLVWNHDVYWDAYDTFIWEEDGDREFELCECLCDVDMMWVDMSF